MSSDNTKIIEFSKTEVSPEEHAPRLQVAVDRLAAQSPVEQALWLDRTAEEHGIEPSMLRALVNAAVKTNEKRQSEQKAEARQREQRAEKAREKARREEERQQHRAQQQADKEVERKRKEREKAFEAIAKLPRLAHEARLAELAKRSGEDPDFLRDEFAAYYVPADIETKPIEPWDQPVGTHALLIEVLAQVRRYVVVQDHVATAITLWILFSWVHEVAVHSPLLVVTSAEPESGKSTLLGVLGLLVPRSYSVVELTGANIYHIVDLKNPTLLIDEADQLFRRKPALAEVVNVGWTRGSARIPRMMHGVMQEFDVFCPKVIGMFGLNLPGTTASRAIVCSLWPKLPSEQVADFRHIDDDAFTALRRKALRWAADSAAALRDPDPVMPSGFGNRVAANYRLLLAIADLAGGVWPKQARAAAVKLSHKHHQPSERLRLLAALRPLLATREQITSAELVELLTADRDGEWIEFRGRGPITQRQVAALLAGFEIFPVVLHPTKQASLSRRGYRRSQFDDAFARFLPQQSEPEQSEPEQSGPEQSEHPNTEV